MPDLAKMGLTQSEAARKLGVSRQRVSQLVVKLGLTFRPYAPPVPKERLKELDRKGLTQTEAATQLGVSQKRVSKIAAELGLAFAAEWMRPRATATEVGRVMQAARLACGYGYTKLAAVSGLDRHHIAAIETGRVKRPTPRTLRTLANGLRPHTSYGELARAAYGGESTDSPADKKKKPRRRGQRRATRPRGTASAARPRGSPGRSR